MSNYDDIIIQVLAEAGAEGLSAGKIARHVYNSSNSFFDTVDLATVRSYVSKFLRDHARNEFFGSALIVPTGRKGVFRLNEQSPFYTQRIVEVGERKSDEGMVEDQTLSLFDL